MVSIITPAYNAQRFIEETIASVRAQTYQDWQHLIVVDGNSKDRTLEIVKNWAAKDARIKCVQDPRAKGAARNRNVGLEIAIRDGAEYVAFIDADDLWTPDKLDKQIAFMKRTGCDLSCTAFTRISEDGQTKGKLLEVPTELTYKAMLKDNPVGCLTVVVSAAAAKEASFKELGWEDLGCWLELLRKGFKGAGLQESLAWYRIVNGSRSNNKIFAARLRWETLRNVEHLPLLSSLGYFSHYMVTGLLKHARIF